VATAALRPYPSGRDLYSAEHPLGVYQIGWKEINRVEFYGTQTIVFRGNNKSLVTPDAVSMAVANRKETLAYIQAQILDRELATGKASLWARSRNVKTNH
jgi:hypothetical protein